MDWGTHNMLTADSLKPKYFLRSSSLSYYSVYTTSPEYISLYCCFLPSSQSALNIKEDTNILEDAVGFDLRQQEDLLPL
jgi:hypothetical protein